MVEIITYLVLSLFTNIIFLVTIIALIIVILLNMGN